MHPIKSIEARMQGYTMNNFQKSKYAKMIRNFKNIHAGETCFIIGNGPSLKAEDLTKINNKGYPTFAFNRIYHIFDSTNWRPSYYISQDEKTLFNCQSEVNAMDIKYKFIPLFHYYYHNIKIQNAYYFRFKANNDGLPFFTEDFSDYVGDSTTVAYTAAQLAVYMGFRKIYLIGVDHNFSLYQNDRGEIIRDESVKDYFTDAYNTDKKDLYIPNLDKSTQAFISMRKYCDEHGIDVFNVTRGGKLEVFQRADIDKILL